MMLRALALLPLLVIPARAAESDVPLPRERPSLANTQPEPVTPPALPTAAPDTPERPYQVACPAVISGSAVAKALPPLRDGQCGLQSPLSLEAVVANGRAIALNTAVTTDCGMATALPAWIGSVDAYVAAHENTRIKSVNFGTDYACRNVDNAAAGRLSFHSFADALDLSGFTLEDGRTISIAPGFNGTPEQGRDVLRFARDAACTHFTTVLGPDADAFHQDNLHIDLACHGKACTARLCQ